MNEQEASLRSTIQTKRSFYESTTRKFVCKKCGKSYAFQQSLNRHYNHECGLEPKFHCPYCEYRTKQANHVKEHVKRRHPGRRVTVAMIVNGQKLTNDEREIFDF